MPIDPRIALGVQQLQVQDPLAQYGKVAAIQSAQNQNALAQYQLSAARRADEQAINRMNALRAAGTDTKAIGNALLQAGDVKGYTDFMKGQFEQQKAQTELIDAKLKQSRAFLGNVNPADPNAPAQFMAWSQANLNDPVLAPVFKQYGVTPEQVTAQVQQAVQAGPAAFAELVQRSKLGTEKFMELNRSQLSTKDIGGTVIDRTFQPITGQITEVSRTAKTMAPGEQERINNEQRRLTQDARRLSLEDRRLAVLEENQRRDADPVFQQQMAAAKETGIKAAQGDVAAQQALPKIIANAEQGMKMIDELIGKRDSTTGKLLKGEKVHPGFQNAVGATWLPGARFVPGTDAANFMSRFDQIKGASFLQAFEALKGGGAITEKEGAKGTDAINRMSTSQSEDEFIRAAMDLQDIIRKGVENAQKRASRSSSRVPAASTASAAPAAAIPESLKNRPDFKELERLWPYMNESDRKTFMGE